MADPEERRQAAPDLNAHDAPRERAPEPDERPTGRRERAGAERRERRRRVEPERRARTRGAERRTRQRRAEGDAAVAGADAELVAKAAAASKGAAKRPPAAERRRERTISEQREYWSQVRRRLRAADLEPFAELLDKLAKAAFGSDATVVPHLRHYGKRPFLLFVVDAACPEACTHYEAFLPLERAFWTAYATVPKPDAAFGVAVRPARGWCRAEALMPLFASMQASEYLA